MPTGVYKRTLEMKTGKHMLGRPVSEETRKKIGNAHKGNKYALGKHWKLSEEWKQAQSKRMMGKNKGKVPTEETRRKLSESHKGDKSYRWKGGITPIHEAIRKSLDYKLWREAVFKRDGYTCVWCKVKSGNGKAVILNADHIKPFAQYPELRFAIDNGRTLCIDCHKTTDTWGRPKK